MHVHLTKMSWMFLYKVYMIKTHACTHTHRERERWRARKIQAFIFILFSNPIEVKEEKQISKDMNIFMEIPRRVDGDIADQIFLHTSFIYGSVLHVFSFLMIFIVLFFPLCSKLFLTLDLIITDIVLSYICPLTFFDSLSVLFWENIYGILAHLAFLRLFISFK